MPKTTVTLMVDTDDPDLQQVIAEILALPEWSPERVSLMVDLMRAEADRLAREYHERRHDDTAPIPVVVDDAQAGRHRSR